MPPPARAPLSLERPKQYGPDPASAAAAYHIEENAQLSSRQPRQDTAITSRPAPSHHRSAGNNHTGHGGQNASQAWFDEANTALREPQLSTDDEPPFHPRGPSSSSSDISSETNVPRRQAPNRTVATIAENAAPTERTDSGDYRSIIDDLTVENRELRERLKRAEAAMAPSAEVQQDRLFEIKVHGLPANQKRELLETLTNFARKHDVLKEAQSSQHPAAGSSTHYASVNRSAQPYGGMVNSSSNEQFDSTPTSASASGKVSKPIFAQNNSSSRKPTSKNVAQPLEGTPAGLLYKGYDPSMTDREKKVMIVRRLEQLFNGKGGSHSKSTHQRPSHDNQTGVEQITWQIREAQILPSIEEAHDDDIGQGAQTMAVGGDGSQHEAGQEQTHAERLSPQRETRPLDVDPDRIPNPQENINYIRHLGMSPKLPGEEASDTGPILGWVYLNLLFGMAQLHIFNVTPDFVRSAITEISTRFELSDDRQKVRWHGGPVDTKSSDSEGDRVMRDTSDSSDSDNKGQKVGDSSGTDTAGPYHNHGHSITASSSNQQASARGRRRYDLDYKPLFVKHTKSAARSHYHDDAASGYLERSTIDGDAYGSAPGTMITHGTNYSQPRSDSGPIVFFSGAHFVTDLSGDPRDAIVQDPRFYQYPAKRAAITPLGADRPKRPRRKITRSESGSRIHMRPFKDYSKCAEILQKDTRLKTPERICSDDANSNDLSFDPKWTDDGKSASPQQRIIMEASGIGGTKPDDNFVVIVETAHPKMRSEFHKQLQAQVATALDPERRTAKLLHMIEDAKLDAAQLSKQWKGKQPEKQIGGRDKSLPVKITVLSKRELRLQPSETPPPAQMWRDDDSDSDSDSDVSMDSSSTDQGIRYLKASPPETDAVVQVEESSEEEDDEDEDDDGEIDMMHADRQQNPDFVAQREGTYDREERMIAAGDIGRRRSASSNATAGDEQDESSDIEDEEEEEDDSGNDDEDASMKLDDNIEGLGKL